MRGFPLIAISRFHQFLLGLNDDGLQILAAAQGEPPEIAVTATAASTGSMAKDRALTGQIGQMLLFFLTLLLSGMVMSQNIRATGRSLGRQGIS